MNEKVNDKKKPTELTRAELEVMQHLWRLGKAFLGEVVESFPQPRPAYTTISTVIQVLCRKGFVGHHRVDKSHHYYPLVSREEYRARVVKRTLNHFFNDSPAQLFSHFAEEGSLTLEQRRELQEAVHRLLESTPVK